jgi:predicted small secreted protein
MNEKENDMIRKALIGAALAAMAISTAACNTVRGVGDDLNSAADAVDEET